MRRHDGLKAEATIKGMLTENNTSNTQALRWEGMHLDPVRTIHSKSGMRQQRPP